MPIKTQRLLEQSLEESIAKSEAAIKKWRHMAETRGIKLCEWHGICGNDIDLLNCMILVDKGEKTYFCSECSEERLYKQQPTNC